MDYKCFNKKPTSLADKSTKGSGVAMLQNEQLAEELHKPIIKSFIKRRLYSKFKDNIWGADLADMQLISKSNKKTRFWLCVTNIFSKYVQVVLLKYKKGKTIAGAFQKILDDSTDLHLKTRKPNKIWVDKGSEFYSSISFKKWLKVNDIETYSTHNEGKFVVSERFIKTLKTKIYKYMASVLKNVYIDKLDDIVNEYNNTYHRTIKMKPIEVKYNTYIDSIKEVNDKDPKLKVGDHVRISKYKNKY